MSYRIGIRNVQLQLDLVFQQISEKLLIHCVNVSHLAFAAVRSHTESRQHKGFESGAPKGLCHIAALWCAQI
jgi:hypothetical protein